MTNADPSASTLQLTAVDSAWGSTGPVPIGGVPRYVVVVLVDVRADQPVTNLRLASLDLLDAAAGSLGKADREISVHVTPSDATVYSPTARDVPFDGIVTPGRPLRLRVHARMEDAFAGRIATTPPSSYETTFQMDAGALVRVSGFVGPPWPTA